MTEKIDWDEIAAQEATERVANKIQNCYGATVDTIGGGLLGIADFYFYSVKRSVATQEEWLNLAAQAWSRLLEERAKEETE